MSSSSVQDNSIDGSALADLDADDLSGTCAGICLLNRRSRRIRAGRNVGMGIKKPENQTKLLKSIRKLFDEARPKTVML
jgi:hypothetical protein